MDSGIIPTYKGVWGILVKSAIAQIARTTIASKGHTKRDCANDLC